MHFLLSVSFLNDLERIASRDYVVSDDDIVRARLRTVGIQEYRLHFTHSPWAHPKSKFMLFSGLLICLIDILKKLVAGSLAGNGVYLMLAVVVPLCVFLLIIGCGINVPYNLACRMVTFLRQR